jgi:hypothetical protein
MIANNHQKVRICYIAGYKNLVMQTGMGRAQMLIQDLMFLD